MTAVPFYERPFDQPCPQDRPGCQHREGACPGHKKQARGGGPCKDPAGKGTDHHGYGLCSYHGGNSPGGKTQGERMKTDAEIAAESARLGLTVTTTPLAAVADALDRMHADVLAAAAQVSTLEPDAWLVWETNGEGGSRQGTHPKLRIYWDRLDRYAAHAAKCVSLGIEAAAVSVVQAQGEQLIRLVRMLVEGLGHDPASPEVVQLVQDVVRRIEGEAA